MIPPDKFPEIAKGLLAATKKGTVNWVENPEEPPDSYGYIVQLPNSCIELTLFKPPTDSDRVTLGFRNPDGLLVGLWEAEDGDANWEVARTLFDEVHRYVTGWDKVLKDVEEFLASEGPRTG